MKVGVRLTSIALLLTALCLGLAPRAVGCIYCKAVTPLYMEIQSAAIVVFGYVSKSSPAPDGVRGTSEFTIETVLKDPSGALKGKTSVTINRLLFANPKVKFLVLADLIQGQFDPYRSFVFNSDRVLKYLREAPRPPVTGQPTEVQKWLRYHFDYLGDPEAEIAQDAFGVWANATNAEVHAAASTLAAERVRQWLLDPKTPPERLSLYAHLLGACGTPADAELLKKLILNPDARMVSCMDGLLGGYIQLRPADGWKLAQDILANGRGFEQKHATLRVIKFYHSATGDLYKQPIGDCLATMLKSADLFDLAVEQLRQWKMWQYSAEILNAFGTETAKAPMTQRAIVRYALSCPGPAGKELIAKLKKADAKTARMVHDVEEELPGFDEPIKR